MELNSISCEMEGCTNKFLKTSGVFVDGKWFCSEMCNNQCKEQKPKAIEPENEVKEESAKETDPKDIEKETDELLSLEIDH